VLTQLINSQADIYRIGLVGLVVLVASLTDLYTINCLHILGRHAHHTQSQSHCGGACLPPSFFLICLFASLIPLIPRIVHAPCHGSPYSTPYSRWFPPSPLPVHSAAAGHPEVCNDINALALGKYGECGPLKQVPAHHLPSNILSFYSAYYQHIYFHILNYFHFTSSTFSCIFF